MASDEFHEAILDKLHDLQSEITKLSHREAMSFAYLVSREMPEEAARMLVAELLLDYRERHRRGRETVRRVPSRVPGP